MLRAPDHAEMFSGVLLYHVVPGRVDAAALAAQIEAGAGQAMLTTVNGAALTASIDEAGEIVLTDAAGHTATVVATDLNASNGVVHVVDAVLMPTPLSHDDMDMMDDGMEDGNMEDDDMENDGSDGSN